MASVQVSKQIICSIQSLYSYISFMKADFNSWVTENVHVDYTVSLYLSHGMYRMDYYSNVTYQPYFTWSSNEHLRVSLHEHMPVSVYKQFLVARKTVYKHKKQTKLKNKVGMAVQITT